MKFSSPNRTIATCKFESCDGCTVNRNLNCHSSPRDLPRFLLIICPTLVLGGAGICHMNATLLMPWLVLLAGCIGFAALRGAGSNCLPGLEKKRVLKSCQGLGALKILKDRPEPMPHRQRVWLFAGIALAWGYPACFLMYGDQVFLLMAYLLSTICFWVTLRSFLCSRCIDFGCPMNAVDDYVRSDFYECNPGVDRLWNPINRPLNPYGRRMKINDTQHAPDGTR